MFIAVTIIKLQHDYPGLGYFWNSMSTKYSEIFYIDADCFTGNRHVIFTVLYLKYYIFHETKK